MGTPYRGIAAACVTLAITACASTMAPEGATANARDIAEDAPPYTVQLESGALVAQMLTGAPDDPSLMRLAHAETAPGDKSKIANPFSDARAYEATPDLMRAAAQEIKGSWVLRDDGTFMHKLSGMECDANQKMTMTNEDTGENTVTAMTLHGLALFNEDGSDTACDYRTQDNSRAITLYATYAPDVSAEEMFYGSVQAMRQALPLGDTLDIFIAAPQTDDGAVIMKPYAAGFDIGKQKGTAYESALWTEKTHGWHIKVRATYPKDDKSVEALAAFMFMTAWLEVDTYQNAAPTNDLVAMLGAR